MTFLSHDKNKQQNKNRVVMMSIITTTNECAAKGFPSKYANLVALVLRIASSKVLKRAIHICICDSVHKPFTIWFTITASYSISSL